MTKKIISDDKANSRDNHLKSYLKFYNYSHLDTAFGSGWFGGKAESFARFFGTPFFLGSQTVLVILWIITNVSGVFNFDLYPFILLNLAFSVQAAYAAPLILLAQTRQAERDKAKSEADAQHREMLALDNIERQKLMQQNTDLILELLQQNTELTSITKKLSEHIEELTLELHKHLLQSRDSQHIN